MTATHLGKPRHTSDSLVLRPGELVEVLSEQEILVNLEEGGTLDHLPFMPEMRAFCGGVFRVSKRVEKTCCETSGLRRMPDAVFLEGVRCDGSGHDGCGRLCLIFWKEAWLRRTDKPLSVISRPPMLAGGPQTGLSMPPDKTYFCQSTELAKATVPVPLWEVTQYVRDLRGRQMTLLEFGRVLLTLAWQKTRRLLGIRDIAGPDTNARKTPAVALDLQPGELVELKSKREIRDTLDPQGKNRGLLFCQEMLRFCGRRARVLRRVDRMILETTGTMCKTSNAVLLEGVLCDGRTHRGCMRQSYYLCKEIWLKRVADGAGGGDGDKRQ